VPHAYSFDVATGLVLRTARRWEGGDAEVHEWLSLRLDARVPRGVFRPRRHWWRFRGLLGW
jgi:hypothetical protein